MAHMLLTSIRGRRIERMAALPLLVVLVLLGAACSSSDNGSEARRAAVQALDLPDLTEQSVEISAPVPVPPAPPAASAKDAVARFMAAEIANDFDTSYGLLAEPDRRVAPVPQLWIRSHADIPEFTRFEIIKSDDTSPEGVVITGTVDAIPSLDEISGLVPAGGELSLLAVPEDGGWRVAFGSTTFVPSYPSADKARTVASRWLDLTARCENTAELEYRFGLLGVTGYAPQLCAAGTPAKSGDPISLADHPNPAPVVAAFGADALGWAQFQRVEGPVEFDLVLAPLGDEWIVLATLLPS